MAIGHLPWLNDAFTAFDPEAEDVETYCLAFTRVCSHYKENSLIAKEIFNQYAQDIYFLFERELPRIEQIRDSGFLFKMTHSANVVEIPFLLKQIIIQSIEDKNLSASHFSKEQNFQEWVTKFLYLTSPRHLNLLKSIPEVVQKEGKNPSILTVERKDTHISLINYTEKSIHLSENLELLIDGLQPLKAEENYFFRLSPFSRTLIFFEFLGQFYMHTQDLEEPNEIKRYAFISHEDKLLFRQPVFFEKALEMGERAIDELSKCQEQIHRKNITIEQIICRKFLDASFGCFHPEEKKESLYGFTVILRHNDQLYPLHTLSGRVFLSEELGLRREEPLIEKVSSEKLIKKDLQELISLVPLSCREKTSPIITKQQMMHEETGEETKIEIANYTSADFFINSFLEPILEKKNIRNEKNIFLNLPGPSLSIVIFHDFGTFQIFSKREEKIEWIHLKEVDEQWTFDEPKNLSSFSSLETIAFQSISTFLRSFPSASQEDVKLKKIDWTRFSDRNLGCGEPEEKEAFNGFIVQLEHEEKIYRLHTLSGISFRSPDFAIEKSAPSLDFDISLKAFHPDINKLLTYVPEDIQKSSPVIFTQTVVDEKNGERTLFEFVNYTKKSLFFNSFREILLNEEHIHGIFGKVISYNNKDCQLILFEYLNLLCLIEKDITAKENTLNVMLISEKRNRWRIEGIEKKIFKNVFHYGSSYLASYLSHQLQKEIENEEINLKRIYPSELNDLELAVFAYNLPYIFTVEAEYRGEKHLFQTSDPTFIDYCKFMRTKEKNIPLSDVAMTSCVIS